jgi:hypothetical protein
LRPGGWCSRKYCSHAGLLYEPGYGSSRLHRQASPRLRHEKTLAGKGGTMGEKWPVILPTNGGFHAIWRDLLHAANLRHGNVGFTSPPKEGMLGIFSSWKIRRLRPGSNPRTRVPDHRRLWVLNLVPRLFYPREKRLRDPLNTKLGEWNSRSGQSGAENNLFPLPGNRTTIPRSSSSQPTHYTDYQLHPAHPTGFRKQSDWSTRSSSSHSLMWPQHKHNINNATSLRFAYFSRIRYFLEAEPTAQEQNSAKLSR